MQQMVNDPIFYATIVTFWLVAFRSFLIKSLVSEIVNVKFLVMPAAACLLILVSLAAITIAQ